MLKTALKYSHELLESCICKGDIVIDATMGNGHDTLFLSQLVGPDGHVYAFDIQEQALNNTRERLGDNIKNTTLIHDGHENIDQYLPKSTTPKAAIFNLGYLPSGDKTIITQAHSTLIALEWLIKNISVDGRIILVVYYGHDGGKDEKDRILEYVQNLDQQFFQVLNYQFLNQRNNPPLCICINKIKSLT